MVTSSRARRPCRRPPIPRVRRDPHRTESLPRRSRPRRRLGMIVRILGEGQYAVSDDAISALNDVDAEVESAIAAGNEIAFRHALMLLPAGVRTAGVPQDPGSLASSALILPLADATLAE